MYSFRSASVVGAPLPEPPGKSTHIAHHLLLVGKIDLPY